MSCGQGGCPEPFSHLWAPEAFTEDTVDVFVLVASSQGPGDTPGATLGPMQDGLEQAVVERICGNLLHAIPGEECKVKDPPSH